MLCRVGPSTRIFFSIHVLLNYICTKGHINNRKIRHFVILYNIKKPSAGRATEDVGPLAE